MYWKFVLKRATYGIAMYIIMVFIYSTLFNSVADKTVRGRIDEELVREIHQLRNITSEQIVIITEQRRALKYKQYHLDQPIVSRIFWRAMSTLTFQFGLSTFIKASNGDRLVINIIGEVLPRTLILFGSVFILVVILGISLGLYTARKPNGFLDRFTSIFTMISNGLPAWWLGMIALMTFAYTIPIFPSGGMQSNPVPSGFLAVLDFLWHLSLPLLTLTILGLWGLAFLSRNIFLSSLQEDYIMAARARGISERRVLFSHSLRSSMPAILTLTILGLVGTVSGNIIVEGIFGWPGIGNLYFVAVEQNDVPVLMASLSIQTVLNMGAFILLDVLYGILDPRIKTGALT